jgi:predicted transposase/invertase (TIGR01784 family)
MTDINKITLKNNAMFNIVMSRPNLCIKCLERILNKRIIDISYPQIERTVDLDIDAKSIRLDVYCEGEDTAYNIELQNGIYDDLPRRSRYYQDLIDIDLLDKGADYSELKNNIIIFICTFDVFGMGRHLYTFENRCLQDESISLGDMTTKIFLNTKGKLDDIPKPLSNFLKYIDTGEVTDEYTRELEDTVIEVRKDKRWRKRIMTVEELIKAEAKQVAKVEKEKHIRYIEEAVTKGVISREDADEIIEKMKWD